MTRGQIKKTIENANMSDIEKQTIQKQCDEGDSETLFAVRGLYLRQIGHQSKAIERIKRRKK
jgi:hypothetical protein